MTAGKSGTNINLNEISLEGGLLGDTASTVRDVLSQDAVVMA